MAYEVFGFRARAVHTDRTLLATAGYMDWSAELRLHEARRGREVICCTGGKPMKSNIPARTLRVPELPGYLPPVRLAACVATDCRRC